MVAGVLLLWGGVSSVFRLDLCCEVDEFIEFKIYIRYSSVLVSKVQVMSVGWGGESSDLEPWQQKCCCYEEE